MTLTICTSGIDWVWFTHSICMHPWHWLICIRDIDQPYKAPHLIVCRHLWHWLNCTRDIDWVWYTFSIDMHSWHWLSASVILTECDSHSLLMCIHDIDLCASLTLTKGGGTKKFPFSSNLLLRGGGGGRRTLKNLLGFLWLLFLFDPCKVICDPLNTF